MPGKKIIKKFNTSINTEIATESFNFSVDVIFCYFFPHL